MQLPGHDPISSMRTQTPARNKAHPRVTSDATVRFMLTPLLSSVRCRYDENDYDEQEDKRSTPIVNDGRSHVSARRISSQSRGLRPDYRVTQSPLVSVRCQKDGRMKTAKTCVWRLSLFSYRFLASSNNRHNTLKIQLDSYGTSCRLLRAFVRAPPATLLLG